MEDSKKIYEYIKMMINPYGRPFEGTVHEFGLKVMEYIANMEKQPKVCEWIPVSEKLPEEEYDTVLVVTDIKHYCVAVYTTEHGFRTGDIDAEGEIVAWMPLIEYKPEPPELIVPTGMLAEALLRTFLGRPLKG